MFNREMISRITWTLVLLLAAIVSTPVGSAAQADQSVAEAVSGQNGMVATAHPLASQAAVDILKDGGNAIDAAVAAAFAIGVVEPDGSGLGGGGGMVVYLSDSDQAHYINYYHKTSQSLDQISYDPEKDKYTAKAVLIPGTVAGLTLALEKFGTLPLARVMQPAIEYAEAGFEVDATLAQILLDNVEIMLYDSVTAATFLDEEFPLMEGDVLYQPELARTLRTIAEKGHDGFYKGEVARAMSEKITRLGGVMTLDDLADYKAELTRPCEGSYRGYRIVSAGAPQSGSAIIQSLNMLENEDLAGLGHYSTSAETLHLMAETFRRVYADRWQYLGDPTANHVPLNGLISKRYARERFLDIDPYQASPRQYSLTQAGSPERYDRDEDTSILPQTKTQGSKWDDSDDEIKADADGWGEDLFDAWGGKKRSTDKPGEDKPAKKDSVADSTSAFDDDYGNDDGDEFGGHTTHLSVIDKDGNMVSLTQTLGTFFGAGITSEGVLFNCGMSNFSRTAVVNLARPGRQPRSSISPTVVLKGDKPLMVVGSPGASRIVCTVAELIVNVIDFHMDAQQTNEAPRFYCQKYEDYLHLEGGISEDLRPELERMGHELRIYGGRDLFFGGAQLILVDPATGLYYGSADPRRGGVAIGY